MNLGFRKKKPVPENKVSSGHPLTWENVYIRKTPETILARVDPNDRLNVIALRPTEQNKNLFCIYERDDSFIRVFFIPALVQALRRGDSIIVCTGNQKLGDRARQICLDNNRSYIEPKDIMNDSAGTRVLNGNCMIVLDMRERNDPLYTLFCDAMRSGALDHGSIHVMIDDLSSFPASEAVIYHTVTTQARWTLGCTSVGRFFEHYGRETAEAIMHRCMTHILFSFTGEADAMYFAKRVGRPVCPPSDRLYICTGRGRFPTEAYKFDPQAMAFSFAEDLDEGTVLEGGEADADAKTEQHGGFDGAY